MKFIDLFAGCGGMSKGFELAGMECAGFVEFWQPAIDTHLRNCGGELIGRDITQIRDEDILKYKGSVCGMVGRPPCQGFSMAGKRDSSDRRNRLFEEFVRFVRIIGPKWFVMENVQAIGSMRNQDGKLVINEVFEAFKVEGYQVECKVLNSQNYGVPQARKRAIFIGTNTGKKIGYPAFKSKVFLKEVLNLPYGEEESIQHVYEKVATEKAYKFSFVKPGKNYGTFRSNNKRLKMDSFACTITKGGRYIHPVYHRLLSVREEARVQSFPDDFVFTGSKDNMYAQIGNAVPVLMAKAIAEAIKEEFSEDGG